MGKEGGYTNFATYGEERARNIEDRTAVAKLWHERENREVSGCDFQNGKFIPPGFEAPDFVSRPETLPLLAKLGRKGSPPRRLISATRFASCF